MLYNDTIEVICARLTAQITSTLQEQSTEESCPSSSPDAMDGKIKQCKDRVEFMRSVRTQLEDSLLK